MIKYFVMDVDGTLTDGKVYMGINEEICKVFNIKDGYGIRNILIPLGIIPIILTGRKSQILLNRCQELGIKEIYQEVDDKEKKLKEVIRNFNEIAYIGDDMNDFGCMQIIKEKKGIVACPADATERVINIADFVSDKNGGDGAVRDFIDWLIEEKKFYRRK